MPSPNTTARALLEERRGLIEQNRGLIDRAEAEKRDFNAEERAEYDARVAKAAELKGRADRITAQEEEERGMERPNREPARPATAPENQTREIVRVARDGTWLKTERRYAVTDTEEQHALKMRRFLANLVPPNDRTQAERRALQMDSEEAGGFTVAPQQFVADVIQAVDNMLFFRGMATINTLIGAHSIGRPSLDADPADADWTSELATGSEDSTMDFGKRELNPHPIAKRLKVSRKLLRHSSNMESLVRERLAYKLAVPQESAFMTGTGVQKPLGIFTASSSGISTGRDVSTGNTTTSITFDGLKAAKWTLKQQYWAKASWIFHRDAGAQIDKLKDGNGQYQWQPSVVAGQPDRLLNLPVNFSEYAPNTFSTGEYVGIIGDYSFYWIVESLSMEVQRLEELYAATNQIGFIVRAELDGMPTLEEAFVRVKLA